MLAHNMLGAQVNHEAWPCELFSTGCTLQSETAFFGVLMISPTWFSSLNSLSWLTLVLTGIYGHEHSTFTGGLQLNAFLIANGKRLKQAADEKQWIVAEVQRHGRPRFVWDILLPDGEEAICSFPERTKGRHFFHQHTEWNSSVAVDGEQISVDVTDRIISGWSDNNSTDQRHIHMIPIHNPLRWTIYNHLLHKIERRICKKTSGNIRKTSCISLETSSSS